MSAWTRPDRRPAAPGPSARACNPLLAQTAGLGVSQTDRARLLFRRYLPLDVIGQGTFGRIMACRDLLWPCDRVVAVKMVAADFHYIAAQERFILACLDSQYVCKVRDAFLHDGQYCLVLDRLGPPVSRLLAPVRRDLRRLRKIALQLIAALLHLHDRRVIHADIKPDNILLVATDPSSRSSKIQLIDFGNALRPTEADAYFDDFDLQSLFYRAPEIVFSSKAFGFPIDMWIC